MVLPVAVIASMTSATITGTLGIAGTLIAHRWNTRKRLERTGQVSALRQAEAQLVQERKRHQLQIQQERSDCTATQQYLRAQIATWQGDAKNAWSSVDRLLAAANKFGPISSAELLTGPRTRPPDEAE